MKDSHPPITDMGSNFSNLQLTVVKGECSSAESEDNCRISYYLAIAIMFSISFANNFGRIGSVLLQIRCIDVNDKVPVGLGPSAETRASNAYNKSTKFI